MSAAPAARLLSCLALLLVAGPLAGQEPSEEPPIVAGVVLDAESGAPIAGALVSPGERTRGAFTDEEGRFTLRRLRPGSHPVMVAQLGYDSLTTMVRVPETGVESVVLRLSPDPVVLEGIQVVTDQLRSRRNSVAVSVRAFDQRDLQLGASRDALEFIQTRTNLMRVACADRFSMGACAYVRGRPTPVAVFIDDTHVLGGLEFLDSYRPEELYLVEIYSGGREIRVYTNWYMEMSARTGRRPFPVLMR